jgi:nitrile hydratase
VDGFHDLGCMHGFGPIPIEHDEPLFHEPWEGRAAVIMRHLMRKTTVDHFVWT